MLRLVGANLNYSSWTIRSWLALEYCQAEFKFFDVKMKTDPSWKERILGFSGAGQVPILIDGSLSIHQSLAIDEYLAELFPGSSLWPEDRGLRARGRALSCEMLSGFSAIRQAMPCNVRARDRKLSEDVLNSPALQSELARLFEVWTVSLEANGGPFLLGQLSIVDFMFAPVLARFRTYGVVMSPVLMAYAEEVFALPIWQKLELLAKDAPEVAEYEIGL